MNRRLSLVVVLLGALTFSVSALAADATTAKPRSIEDTIRHPGMSYGAGPIVMNKCGRPQREADAIKSNAQPCPPPKDDKDKHPR